MKHSMSLQNIIMALHDYWNRHGCLLMNPYDVETGAGTMNPMTTLRAVGPEEWNVAYVNLHADLQTGDTVRTRTVSINTCNIK